MKVLLAAPTEKIALGMAGRYCKKTLEELGHQVEVFDFRKKPYPQSRFLLNVKSMIRKVLPSSLSPYDMPAIKSLVDRSANKKLLKFALTYKPNLLFVLLGENIWPETIVEIKEKTGAVTINWIHDTLLLPSRRDFLRFVMPYYDHIFTVDSKEVLTRYGIEGRNIDTLPVGCDTSVFRRMELSKNEIKRYGSDVAFLGSVIPVRERLLEEIADFNPGIWGRWPKRSPRLERCYKEQDTYEDEPVKIYNASKIVLDFHGLYGEGRVFNVSPRVFEVPASGGFLLTNYCSQLAELYKIGEEMVAYKDIEELRRLIRYYLDHPQERRQISERGYKRTRSEHTYLCRMRKLLSTVMRQEPCRA